MKLPPMMDTVNPVQRPLNKPVWWVVFALSTVLMSLWFKTFKSFTVVPNFTTGALNLAVTAVLIVAVGTLIYDSYVQEAQKGRILKPFAPFEWMIRRHFLIRPVASNQEPMA